MIVTTRPVLVSHWMPLANAALSMGQAAFVAQRKAAERHVLYVKVMGHDLPEPKRERGWALQTRDRVLGEASAAAAEAGSLCEQWARLMDRLWDLNPLAADDVEWAVWDQPHRAAALAAIHGWLATRDDPIPAAAGGGVTGG